MMRECVISDNNTEMWKGDVPACEREEKMSHHFDLGIQL